MSHVSTVLSALVGILQADPPVSAHVERVRLRPVKATAPTAVVVRPRQTEVLDPPRFDGQPVAWQLLIAVECYARVTPGQPPDAALDSLTSAVYARVMADQTLGGACNLVQPVGLAYDFDADGEQTACGVFTFSVRSVTQSAVF